MEIKPISGVKVIEKIKILLIKKTLLPLKKVIWEINVVAVKDNEININQI